jgi:hypothetical protein
VLLVGLLQKLVSSSAAQPGGAPVRVAVGKAAAVLSDIGRM